MKKRLICFLLLLCMLLPMAFACSKDEEGGVEESSVSDVESSTESETENKYDVYDNLGDVDLGGRKITIASVDRSWYDDEIDVARNTGNIVNDAIYKRNMLVEKRMNINIESIRLGNRGNDSGIQYAVVNDLRRNAGSGIHSYDIISAPVYCTIMYTGENLFHDLKDLDAIDFDQVYWSQLFNETASIGESQYMATGAISLSYYRFIFATYVNNNVLATKADAPDLVQVVKDGKWTLEYQRILANQYYVNVGDSSKDEQDTFGHVTSEYLNVDPYWSSCEISILKKNDANYYEYDLNTDRLSGVVDLLIQAFTDNGTFCYRPDGTDETGNGEQEDIAKKFASGTALMATIRLIEAENEHIRDMKDPYTILPIPRWSEDQDNYYSFVHDSFTGVAVPSTSTKDDAQVFGQVLEAMASESYRTVTPAYYETALKVRYSGSAASWDMLDMITENVYMDGGVLYTKKLKNVHQLFRSIMVNAYRNGKGNTVSSTYSPNYGESVKVELATLQDSIKALKTAQ